LSLARCQDMVPLVQKKIQTAFLASVVVLGLGTHAPLLSMDRPGYALSAKGYAYGLMPGFYLYTHAPIGSGYRELLLEVVQRRITWLSSGSIVLGPGMRPWTAALKRSSNHQLLWPRRCPRITGEPLAFWRAGTGTAMIDP